MGILINRLKNWVLKPFSDHIGIMAIWFLLMVGPDSYYFVQKGTYEALPFFLSRSYLASYLLTLVYSYLKYKTLKYSYLTIVSFAITIFFIIDIFCILKLHDRYSYDMAAIVVGTNLNETVEFLYTYISFDLILLLTLTVMLAFILYFILRRFHLGRHFQIVGIVLLITSIYFHVTNDYMLNGIYSKYYSFYEIPRPPDLRAYECDPHIIVDPTQLPKNIIILIGESFSKSHSSLYDYDKDTNPKLAYLEKDSSLIVFKNVTSPATHTLEAFHYILNTYQVDSENKTSFEESVTLPNVARCSGYKTFWISNQSKHGQNDNLVGSFADLCDEEFFVDNKFTGLNRWSKDESLFAPLKNIAVRDNSVRKFVFVHLMGSHLSFKARYPQKFAYFDEGDYLFLPEHQRRIMAEYDNSILYNDYVVDSIIHTFMAEESVVLYFSDHALDIYESSSDWCGHARTNDLISYNIGRQIPFFIFTSKRYMQRFPIKVEQMRNCSERPFCTDKLIFAVMDIMGISFCGNNDVSKFSLFANLN